ncbi:hydrogenase nickel incorporation protein HypB [Robertkochia aurantiaca]|uniref:hydrogenase nickel incorporation protein HypB n=1 Tax=Robertkochia aurantiaca TaxID=2873700 RepID=UPI001CD00EEB|nr:hydrogenase nickel incorporation protein HypB [Robertkochia sp. 3YJGBD-33]
MCGTCGCGGDGNHMHLVTPKQSKDLKSDQMPAKGRANDQINGHEHHHHAHHHDHVHDGHHHDHHHDHHGHSHHHDHDHKKKVIEVEQDVLHHNELMAARNRGYFEALQVAALNLVSSPGSGKTAILEHTLNALKEEIAFYVIEGDQQTDNDANRIAATGTSVVQINTGKGCHLESDMIYEAVQQLQIKTGSVLFIENVGNLVCPAMFNLGETDRVVIISTTEGVDKPLKYPDMFLSSQLCLINKTDLLSYLDIDLAELKENALKINPNLSFIEVSATKGTGMEQWFSWLKEKIKQPQTQS